jgi:hypothetical protein
MRANLLSSLCAQPQTLLGPCLSLAARAEPLGRAPRCRARGVASRPREPSRRAPRAPWRILPLLSCQGSGPAATAERCSKPCFGPSEGVGGALAPAGGPNVRGCQPLSAAPGVTPGAPSPAAAPKKGTRMHVRTRAASLQLYVQPEFIGRILPLR